MAKTISSKGSDFEKASQAFFKKIFEEIGFLVLSVRKQWAGTQNGFDIRITFLDDDEKERILFFECKDYESPLDWHFILEKILELEGSNYQVDGFVVLSPKIDISNIDDNMSEKLKAKFKFPIRYLTPESYIKELFSVEPDIYESIYNEKPSEPISRQKTLDRFKAFIVRIIEEKYFLSFLDRIEIKESNRNPTESEVYITNLDEKLNSVFEVGDPAREAYHKLRCDYKIYLEELSDVNNQLRLKIINWQDNLKIKASRLTQKFLTDDTYSPKKFFYDFFEIAEKELCEFYSVEKLSGDKEKLLNGVVFELAAECPLDWRKNK